MRKFAHSSGQALVLVLLSLAVVLTLVLFILSRTITDISVSTSEEEAIRAFSAAEAGIEQALLVASDVGNAEFGDASFNAKVTGYAENSSTFNYPISLASGDTATVWFIDHNQDGTFGANHFSGGLIKVCWAAKGTAIAAGQTPAIELSVFYDDGTVKIARAAVDPDAARTATNSFAQASVGDCTIGEKVYQYSAQVQFSDLGIADATGLLFARARMLYNTGTNHFLGFDTTNASENLPAQGLSIDSTGTAGEANRRIEVFQAWPEPPTIFDYAIFSNTGLIKQN